MPGPVRFYQWESTESIKPVPGRDEMLISYGLQSFSERIMETSMLEKTVKPNHQPDLLDLN